MKDFFLKQFNSLKMRLVIEKERIHIQFLFLYIIFCIISFAMAVVNLFTGHKILTVVTMIFGLCNALNAILINIRKKNLELLSKILFSIETIALFVFFIISGEPDGFSVIWIALLPVCGMLLFKIKTGSIISGVLFVILAFLFWTPIGRNFLQYEYTNTFMQRFPILYLAFYLVGLFFETVRSATHKELVKARDNFRKLSLTDGLTGLGNETFYFITLKKLEKAIEKGEADFGIAVMDVNCVKLANDTFGHRYGCHLIVTAGKTLPYIFKSSEMFHVGGDEFIVILSGEDLDKAKERIELFTQKLGYSTTAFEGQDLTLSVAIGYSVYEKGDKFTDVFQRADKCMYKNKKELKEKYKIEIRNNGKKD